MIIYFKETFKKIMTFLFQNISFNKPLAKETNTAVKLIIFRIKITETIIT